MIATLLTGSTTATETEIEEVELATLAILAKATERGHRTVRQTRIQEAIRLTAKNIETSLRPYGYPIIYSPVVSDALEELEKQGRVAYAPKGSFRGEFFVLNNKGKETLEANKKRLEERGIDEEELEYVCKKAYEAF